MVKNEVQAGHFGYADLAIQEEPEAIGYNATLPLVIRFGDTRGILLIIRLL